MAFSLGDILVNIKANTDGLKKGVSDVNDMGNQTNTLGDKIQKGMNVAAAGMAVVGAGLTLYAKNATDFTENLVKSSKTLGVQLGISTVDASRLSAAIGRMGIDSQSAAQLFGIFEKQIQAATNTTTAHTLADQKLQIQIDMTKQSIKDTTDLIAKNGDASGVLALKLRDLNNTLATQQNSLGTAANTFAKLGISVVDSSGKQKDFNTILLETADKFAAMPNGVQKTADAMSLFGRSGKDMLKVLDLGSQGITNLETQADKLGLTLNAGTIVAISNLVQSQKDLKQQTDAMKIAVGTATAPVLTEFNKTLLDVLQSVIGTDGPLKTLAVNVLAFGGPVFTAAGGFLALAANAAQAAPAIKSVTVAMYDFTKAQLGFNAAADSNPYGLVIVTLAAFAGAIWWALNNMQQLGAYMVTFTSSFSGPLGQGILGLITIFMPFIGIPLEIVSHWGGISDFFSVLLQNITNAFNGFINFLVTVVSGIGSAVSGFIFQMQRFPGGVANMIDSAIAWFKAIPGRITGAIGDLGSLLYNAGVAVIQGFLNGILKKYDEVKSTVGGIGKWISDHKGPIDMDKKLLIPHGQAIMQGLQKGLQNEWLNVQSLVTSMGVGISGTLAAGTMNVVGAGNNSNSTSIYGNINIGSQADADYLMRRLDRNTQLSSMGAATINPAGSP